MSKKFDNDSLSHTRWNCKYHIVFAPKYRRQIIYGKIKNDIGKILRTLCERKGVEIIEAEACSDHIHMLVSIPPKISISSFMGYLKGKSSFLCKVIIIKNLSMIKNNHRKEFFGKKRKKVTREKGIDTVILSTK